MPQHARSMLGFPFLVLFTNEANLEMLFLDPKYFKQGYGTEILQTLIQEHKVQYVPSNHKYASTCEKYVGISFFSAILSFSFKKSCVAITERSQIANALG
jgi:GNAT superfamily N-acetyltransferase